jgi:[ribosomal protein S5]-alanine N-acetyltransferase
LDDIETTRLILRRLGPDAIQAGLSGDLAALEGHLGATIPVDLLQDPAVLRYAQAQLASDANYLPWSARALVLKDSMQMVGHVRFHSRPDPDYLSPYATNAVEFGYVVFAAYRRRRYAEEALTGLMQWAQEIHDVSRFVVTIAPDNLPSRNLAAKFGFQKIGEHVDAIDGVEDIFLRDATVRPRTAAGSRRSS